MVREVRGRPVRRLGVSAQRKLEVALRQRRGLGVLRSADRRAVARQGDLLGHLERAQHARELAWNAGRILRDVDTCGTSPEGNAPHTRVRGPSTSSFQPAFFEAFLSSCLRAGCEVNFLCWHELDPWFDIALVEKNVRYARKEYVENARFQKLKLNEIHVNEYVGEVDQYRPGGTACRLPVLPGAWRRGLRRPIMLGVSLRGQLHRWDHRSS